MGVTLVGAGYRPELPQLFSAGDDGPQCAELIANRFISPKGVIRAWEFESLDHVPIILHGVSGNVASVTGPEPHYLEKIAELAAYTQAIIYSDHLAFTAAHDRALGHLAPNRFDDELLECACRHIELIHRISGYRPCLENLATKTVMAGSQYTPEEFYLKLLRASSDWDCLVDLTNVWINSQNRSVDVDGFLTAIPPDRVRYIHLAGGRWMHGELVDSHSESVHPEVFDLLGEYLMVASPDAIIVERDSNFEHALAEVRDSLSRARDLVAQAHEARQLSTHVV